MGSLRYSNSLEPLRELETVRIKLVKDFIDEPMLAAKFPLWRGLSSSDHNPGGPRSAPSPGRPRCALCAPHLVCRHRKVWMGKGIPRPLSCSWPSELFLFTMMVAPGSPTAGLSAGSSLAAAPASSSLCSPQLSSPPSPRQSRLSPP